jgi:hypothetical protein
MKPIDVTRREFFTTAAGGLGGVALTSMLDQAGAFAAGTTTRAAGAAVNPLANRPGHFPAKAKSCIFIFLAGAPSQLDLFNYRPELNKLDGQKMPESLSEGVRFAFIQKDTARLMASRRKFTSACFSPNIMDFSY